jgi:hypothetical protein
MPSVLQRRSPAALQPELASSLRLNRSAYPHEEGLTVSLTASERETIITLNDEDETAQVYTAQRPWITKLKRNPSAILLEEGSHDGSAWARFELPKGLVSLRSTKVKRELTEEQREALRERMAHAREARIAA